MLSVIGRVPGLFRLQKTLTADQVALLYREPGVLGGYRQAHRSTAYYVASAVQINNETVNVWTHLVGFLLILYRFVYYTDGFQVSDQRLWPLLGFCTCCLLYTGLSVCAHVVHSKSHLVHYTCFQLDYAGIALYAFGGALPIYFDGADTNTRLTFEPVFLPTNLLLSWLCFVCCCFAKLRYRRPYPFRRKLFQVIPFGIHGILNSSMLAPRALRCYHDNCDDPALAIYKDILTLAVLTAITFSTHLPEKMWPGVFDFVGQGHHWFHVLSVLLTLRQCDAAYQDALRHQEAEPAVHLRTLLALVAALCALCVATVVLMRPFVLRRIEQDKLLDKTH
ncbi:membrane progestin receptor beta-like [Gigantopelta aegis]|uniref:membrane progestin receptor beta-like n=1 Tax=Gigantopelta aegis TaxID=1735272 RepID=UPI001B88A5CE|nr:membrane progestin receptor beta-like [Gigantopelta aegis]